MPELSFLQAGFLITIASAGLAAGTSWVVNGLVIPPTGNRGIVYLAPLVEETSKTLWAVGLGSIVLGSHFIFGVIEGYFELRRRGFRGMRAAGTAVAAHGLFGTITTLTMDYFSLIPSLMLAYLAHAAWNMIVVYWGKDTLTS